MLVELDDVCVELDPPVVVVAGGVFVAGGVLVAGGVVVVVGVDVGVVWLTTGVVVV